MEFDKPSRRRLLRWTLIILVAAAAIAFIVHQSITFVDQPQQRRGRFQDNGNQPVGVARIRRGDIRLTLRALGTVTPLTTVTVTTQISGELMSVGFKEGQVVRKGQFLAQIDPRPYQVALEQDEAQLARDEAALKQAQMDLTRYQTLSQQSSIPRQTYEDQVYVVKQDQGTVDLDKAQIKSQQLNLIYCHIVAPADGRVGLRQVDPGNYIQAGSTTGIVVLTLLHPISVIYAVPEDSLPAIMARVHAGATLPVTAFDRANVNELASGTFAAIDTQVDTTTGTVRLRANFNNPDENLFPSQFVNIVMLLDTLQGVVTVPVRAVQRGAPGTYVYVVSDDDTVSVHPIKLGAQDGDWFQVESGLAPGDRVVTDGADRLRDGAKVTIPDASHDGSGTGSRPGSGRRRNANGADAGEDRSNRPHRHRPMPPDDAQQGSAQKPQGSAPDTAPPPAQPDSAPPGSQRARPGQPGSAPSGPQQSPPGQPGSPPQSPRSLQQLPDSPPPQRQPPRQQPPPQG